VPGVRVLIVDDEPDILDLLQIWFGDDDRGAALACYSQLDGVVEGAADFGPDAIVLDFWFGARTSAGILRSLRTACPRATIFIHTASSRAAISENVLSLGADRVIEKASIGIDELVTCVLDAALVPAPTVIDLTTAEQTAGTTSSPS